MDHEAERAIDRELCRLGELSRKFWFESRVARSRANTYSGLSKTYLKAVPHRGESDVDSQCGPEWQVDKAA